MALRPTSRTPLSRSSCAVSSSSPVRIPKRVASALWKLPVPAPAEAAGRAAQAADAPAPAGAAAAVVQHEVRSRNGQLGIRGKLGRKADGLRGKAAGQRQPILPRRDAQRALALLAQDAQNGRVRQRPHREPGPEPGAPRKGAAQPGRAGAQLRLIIDIAGRRKRAEQLLRRKDGVLRIAPLRRGHCADKAGSGP